MRRRPQKWSERELIGVACPAWGKKDTTRNRIVSYRIASDHIASCHDMSCSIVSCRVVSCSIYRLDRIVSHRIRSHCTIPYPTLPYHMADRYIVSCLVTSRCAASCRIAPHRITSEHIRSYQSRSYTIRHLTFVCKTELGVRTDHFDSRPCNMPRLSLTILRHITLHHMKSVRTRCHDVYPLMHCITCMPPIARVHARTSLTCDWSQSLLLNFRIGASSRPACTATAPAVRPPAMRVPFAHLRFGA
jgi:hypothetical protein